MGTKICMIVYMVMDGVLIRVALACDSQDLTGDVREYPMEPENRQFISNLLPSYMRQPIIKVEFIEDFHITPIAAGKDGE